MQKVLDVFAQVDLWKLKLSDANLLSLKSNKISMNHHQYYYRASDRVAEKII